MHVGERDRYCSTKGRSTRASPCASQGMPATTGGTVANWPEAASRLCKWVVPLRMWPTMKIGGGAGPARCCASAVHAHSASVKGSRPMLLANAIPSRSEPAVDGRPFCAMSCSSVARSAPHKGWNTRCQPDLGTSVPFVAQLE